LAEGLILLVEHPVKLVPREPSLYVVHDVQLVADEDVPMGVEERPNERVAAARIADEEQEAFDVAKQRPIPPRRQPGRQISVELRPTIRQRRPLERFFDECPYSNSHPSPLHGMLIPGKGYRLSGLGRLEGKWSGNQDRSRI
jgi:hypothetical protein